MNGDARLDGLLISEVAACTGFTPSALRFYEDAGLVTPGRTAAGYRVYDRPTVESLQFIARAKRLGLSLSDITDLVPLFVAGSCAPIQARLHSLVDDRIANAQSKIAELVAFIAELKYVALVLAEHTPDGACDDRCGCLNEPNTRTHVAVHLTPRLRTNNAVDPIPIACTLSADRVDGRVGEWRALVALAEQRERTTEGVRLTLPRSANLQFVVGLLEAEQRCCRFFTFTLTITNVCVVVEISVPADARSILDEIVG